MKQPSLFKYWRLCWTERFVRFEGRARRSEFWGYMLFNYVLFHLLLIGFLIFLGLVLLTSGIFDLGDLRLAYDGDYEKYDGHQILLGIVVCMVGLYFLVMGLSFIPTLAVFSRRLHDAGYSAIWLLLYFVPMGGLALLVFACLDSQPHANKWGDNPKEVEEEFLL